MSFFRYNDPLQQFIGAIIAALIFYAILKWAFSSNQKMVVLPVSAGKKDQYGLLIPIEPAQIKLDIAVAQKLLAEFKRILRGFKAKGKTDFSQSTRLKDHLLLYYAMTAFSKRMCEPFPRQHLFLNGWKRIGRTCRRNNLPTRNPEQDFGLIQDKLNVKNICGFHWCNVIYVWSSIKQIPELNQFFIKLSEDCEGHQVQPLRDEHKP